MRVSLPALTASALTLTLTGCLFNLLRRPLGSYTHYYRDALLNATIGTPLHPTLHAVFNMGQCTASGGLPSAGEDNRYHPYGGRFADLEALESQLEVPFFILDTPALTELHDMCQEAAQSILNGEWPEDLDRNERKNMNEVFWLDQLWNDPWRTRDPDKALVFVLPVYPVLLLQRTCGEKDKKAIHLLGTIAVKEVTQLPHWRRNGGLDHVMVATHWQFKNGDIKRALGKTFATFAKNITWGRHVTDNHKGLFGCAVTIPHTSSMTALQPAYQPFEKESLLQRGLIDPADVFEDDLVHTALDPPSRYDWFARDYMMFFQGAIDGFRPFRQKALKHLAGWHYSPESCTNCTPSKNVFVSTARRKGELPYCPRGTKNLGSTGVKLGNFERCHGGGDHKDRHPLYAEASFMHRLANSKLNLCFRGTDVTSSRNTDGFWGHTLNVLITEVADMYRYAVSFQCEVPWRNFTYAVEGSAFKEDPRKAMRPVLDELYMDPEAIREKLRLMKYYSRKVLWNAPNSTTARSTLRAITRQCLSEEMKTDWLQRTYEHGASETYRDHPLFSPCVFPDTLARREEQREPCMTCWVGYKKPKRAPLSRDVNHNTTTAPAEMQKRMEYVVE
ncbi:unnamed protein product [Vitrella brassicaformis CCMP3155]|uniref:Exostosin GT47 domain-containing protein n=1 Tax=Vitrella brassicaformis (strain CCMP3155) TaxID=1169540 RepID=A0A0G4EF20_VITBC|nr:unnamed protein product [Vitrella brassicaformis CCMP3155]|eukprot:CEL94119.1 unnamed protein product [Vitrella brassicaformis CCMP3155]